MTDTLGPDGCPLAQCERAAGEPASADAAAAASEGAPTAFDIFSAGEDEPLAAALDELFEKILSQPRDATWREIDW
ncbi:MAG: hypothetical protein ACFE0R_19470 [Salinarimonas sp.]